MSIRTRKRLQRKTKISIGAIDRGLILSPTPSPLLTENFPLQRVRYIYRRLHRNHCLAALRWIAGEADAEPFPGVRCSVGLQRPRVLVPGRLRHLTVEIANVCPFFRHMIGIGSFREAGNPWRLRESRQPNNRLNCTLDQWPKVQ